MAGNYPDPIAPRLAYDRDGSVGFTYNVNAGTVTQQANSVLADMNDESLDGDWPAVIEATILRGLIFPTKRDLRGLFTVAHNSFVDHRRNFYAIETSTNTTNGMDGTWVSTGVTWNGAQVGLAPQYRGSGIQAINADGVVGIRWGTYGDAGAATHRLRVVHVYGRHSEVTPRLEFWHPTNNQPLTDVPAILDWGNRPRTSTEWRNFRVKNLSLDLTAHNILVQIEALTDSTPTFVSQHEIEYPKEAGNWAANQTITTLAPGEISQEIRVRQSLLDNATLGLWVQRFVASAGSWA